MRLDKWLKLSRLIKRRTVANEACDNQRITANGRVVKASYEVKPGDVVEHTTPSGKSSTIQIRYRLEGRSSFTGGMS